MPCFYLEWIWNFLKGPLGISLDHHALDQIPWNSSFGRHWWMQALKGGLYPLVWGTPTVTVFRTHGAHKHIKVPEWCPSKGVWLPLWPWLPTDYELRSPGLPPTSRCLHRSRYLSTQWSSPPPNHAHGRPVPSTEEEGAEASLILLARLKTFLSCLDTWKILWSWLKSRISPGCVYILVSFY